MINLSLANVHYLIYSTNFKLKLKYNHLPCSESLESLDDVEQLEELESESELLELDADNREGPLISVALASIKYKIVSKILTD